MYSPQGMASAPDALNRQTVTGRTALAAVTAGVVCDCVGKSWCFPLSGEWRIIPT